MSEVTGEDHIAATEELMDGDGERGGRGLDEILSQVPLATRPLLHGDCARRCHICTGTGLTPPTSTPGLRTRGRYGETQTCTARIRLLQRTQASAHTPRRTHAVTLAQPERTLTRVHTHARRLARSQARARLRTHLLRALGERVQLCEAGFVDALLQVAALKHAQARHCGLRQTCSPQAVCNT